MNAPLLLKTNKFNTTKVKDHFINDICFGDDLADWLFTQVKAKGLMAVKPWQEDFGWQLEVENCLISIGFSDDEWQVYCEPIVSFFQKLTGKKGDNTVVYNTLKQIFNEESEIELI